MNKIEQFIPKLFGLAVLVFVVLSTSACSSLTEYQNEPKDIEIDNILDKNMVQLLRALKDWDVNQIRNDVAHKMAYRPKRTEVENILDKYKTIIFGIAKSLNIKHETLYLNRH